MDNDGFLFCDEKILDAPIISPIDTGTTKSPLSSSQSIKEDKGINYGSMESGVKLEPNLTEASDIFAVPHQSQSHSPINRNDEKATKIVDLASLAHINSSKTSYTDDIIDEFDSDTSLYIREDRLVPISNHSFISQSRRESILDKIRPDTGIGIGKYIFQALLENSSKNASNRTSRKWNTSKEADPRLKTRNDKTENSIKSPRISDSLSGFASSSRKRPSIVSTSSTSIGNQNSAKRKKQRTTKSSDMSQDKMVKSAVTSEFEKISPNISDHQYCGRPWNDLNFCRDHPIDQHWNFGTSVLNEYLYSIRRPQQTSSLSSSVLNATFSNKHNSKEKITLQPYQFLEMIESIRSEAYPLPDFNDLRREDNKANLDLTTNKILEPIEQTITSLYEELQKDDLNREMSHQSVLTPTTAGSIHKIKKFESRALDLQFKQDEIERRSRSLGLLPS